MDITGVPTKDESKYNLQLQWNLSITDLRIKDTSVIQTADEGPER